MFKGKYCENETTFVPKGHMVWWRKFWWIQLEDRTWRAAIEREIRCNESTLC